jgi:O-succinylbenzoate synthase
VSQSEKSQLATAIETARVVSIPMRTRFRGVAVREALLFQGSEGWAEWSPFVEYGDEEAAVWLAAAVDFANNSTPPLHRNSIGINATLPAVKPSEVQEALAPFGDFRTVKIKVAEPGQGLNEDLQRIFEVRRLFPGARLRLDANGGYSVEQALALANAVFENGIELDYLEQPVATIAELAEVRLKLSRLGIKVAADESVRKVSDPLAVAQAGAADLLVIKAAPLGGINRALGVIRESGLPAVISSALETSVGISMGLNLAAALPELDFDCGLGTVALLEADVCDEPLIPVSGRLTVRRATPSPARLDALAANAERSKWWLDRLERCAKLL